MVLSLTDVCILALAATFSFFGLKSMLAVPDWSKKLGATVFSHEPYSLHDRLLLLCGIFGGSSFAIVGGPAAVGTVVQHFFALSALGLSGFLCLGALRIRRAVDG
jgi:hypothetical protein